MRRTCLLLLCGVVLCGLNVRGALASKVFVKWFNAKYGVADPQTDAQKELAAVAKKAKCYVCHIKGKKKEFCNPYGEALREFLDHDDFKKERCEKEPEKVKEEIWAALEKVEPSKAPSGTPFGDLLKAGKLPK